MSSPPVLTIAGSDPSGGAGIQADLKTFAAFQCYGMAAVTALTVQNTLGVKNVYAVSPDAVEQQIAAVLEDIQPKAIKTGMLYDANNTRALVRAISSVQPIPPIIVDPVSVSTSGHTLLSQSAVDTIISELLPLSTLVTPNKPEAEMLLSRAGSLFVVNGLADMILAAKELLKLGPKAALVKGGHIRITSMDEVMRVVEQDPEIQVFRDCGVLDENMDILIAGGDGPERLVVDVLSTSDGHKALFVRPFLDSNSTHGTGCTLSAAIAAALARNIDLIEAVHKATVFTHIAIEMAPGFGQGHGPLNHLHTTHSALIPLPTPSCPFPLTQYFIRNTAQLWKDYVQHPFVCKLGEGTLPREKFVHFMVQDYHYLKYYSRAYGMLAAKSSHFAPMEAAARVILSIVNETGTHKALCDKFGVSNEDIERTPETLATRAYGGYLMDAGLQGDAIKLQVSLLACLLGYGQVGLWLRKQKWVDVSETSTNPYVRWIEDYSGDVYQTAVRVGLELIEAKAVQDPPTEERLKEWLEIWRNVTWLEKCFWDSAMNA